MGLILMMWYCRLQQQKCHSFLCHVLVSNLLAFRGFSSMCPWYVQAACNFSTMVVPSFVCCPCCWMAFLEMLRLSFPDLLGKFVSLFVGPSSPSSVILLYGLQRRIFEGLVVFWCQGSFLGLHQGLYSTQLETCRSFSSQSFPCIWLQSSGHPHLCPSNTSNCCKSWWEHCSIGLLSNPFGEGRGEDSLSRKGSDVFSLFEYVSLKSTQISFAVQYRRNFSPMSLVMELTTHDITILFSDFQALNFRSSFDWTASPERYSSFPLLLINIIMDWDHCR